MGIVVQKYGGSSVADAEGVKRVARRIVETKKAGNQVVVVVSAMYVNGVDVLQTKYDIADYWDLASVNAQYAGEVLNRESDVVGTSDNNVSFSNIAYYKDDGSSNVPTNLVYNVTWSRHHAGTWTTPDGQQHMGIWTDPL